MTSLKNLINKKIAENATQLICDAAMASLIRNKACLSGDDSELQNTWEEICVQTQGERSFFWEAYEAAMRDAVMGVFFVLDYSVLQNLWLHTNEGWDLLCDLTNDFEDGAASNKEYEQPELPVDDEYVARQIITKHLLPIAETYTNQRIEAFLNPDIDELDELDDEDVQIEVESGNKKHPSMDELSFEYYEADSDNGRFFTCINNYYIFQIWSRNPEPKWECINLNHGLWDAVHQQIYRNFRADRISKEDLPANLPSPPDSIPLEVQNLPPEPLPEEYLTADYPALEQYLRQCDGGATVYFLVLCEDVYESQHGDGRFHYPEAIFFDLDGAKAFQPDLGGNYRCHIRPGLILLDGDHIECQLTCRLFDHFNSETVFSMLTAKIETLGLDAPASTTQAS